jgi:L-lactate dehydrogenase complex protein LldG
VNTAVEARHAILGRLRAAAPAAPEPMPATDPAPATATSRRDRAQRFAAHARSWRAEIVETTLADWRAALAETLARLGDVRVLAGCDTWIAEAVANSIAPAKLRWFDAPFERLKGELFERIDVGVTTCAGGIAETGSLILRPDIDEPRTLSLVPPVHVAVLRTDTLFETLHEAMLAQQWASAMPTNLLLVTGPSKTADIQRLLVYGAHGPKRLLILLVDAGEDA